jgi:hypothetical protein
MASVQFYLLRLIELVFQTLWQANGEIQVNRGAILWRFYALLSGYECCFYHSLLESDAGTIP